MRDETMRDAAGVEIEALQGAKSAFTTRRVRREGARAIDPDPDPAGVGAGAGDLILAEVEAIGQHARLQLAEGRRSELYVGDRVVVACASRYACDRFEAEAVIDPDACDLIADGGVAGRMLRAHDRMKAPTRLRPLGRLLDASGRAMNLREAALPAAVLPAPAPLVIAVLGSSMNAGKTTTDAAAARGLERAGLRVGATKITGTGAFGDYNALRDAGIEHVLDFTDAGLAST